MANDTSPAKLVSDVLPPPRPTHDAPASRRGRQSSTSADNTEQELEEVAESSPDPFSIEVIETPVDQKGESNTPTSTVRSPLLGTLVTAGSYYGKSALSMAGTLATSAAAYARTTGLGGMRSSSGQRGSDAAQDTSGLYPEGRQRPPLSSSSSPLVDRTSPFEEEEWNACFDDDGKVRRPSYVRNRVYTGGCANNSVRRSLWEFLLGVYPWDSTYDKRETILHSNTKKYYEMLELLNAMDLTEEEKDSMEQINKDVIRTDRELPFYGDPEATLNGKEPLPINLERLRSILGVYSVIYNPQLPYIQGMNEYASVLLYVHQGEESDTFWCFVKVMQFMGDFFLPEDRTVMNRQFHTLMQLVGDTSPQLYTHLASHECSDVVFAYRWMLLNMKREFPFEQALTVLEVTWSMPMAAYIDNRINLGKNPYLLFIALAVFDIESPTLQSMDYSEILLHMNRLSGKMDMNLVLRKAEELYWKFVRGSVPEERLAHPTTL
eukprot:CFRG1603T1